MTALTEIIVTDSSYWQLTVIWGGHWIMWLPHSSSAPPLLVVGLGVDDNDQHLYSNYYAFGTYSHPVSQHLWYYLCYYRKLRFTEA